MGEAKEGIGDVLRYSEKGLISSSFNLTLTQHVLPNTDLRDSVARKLQLNSASTQLPRNPVY